MLRGQYKQIGLTQKSVTDLRGNSWHTSKNDKYWKFVSEETLVPIVNGKWTVARRWIVDLEKPIPDDLGPPAAEAPNIMWQCPFCHENHFTNVDLGDSSPSLWYCEMSHKEEVALVKWQKPRAKKARLSKSSK